MAEGNSLSRAESMSTINTETDYDDNNEEEFNVTSPGKDNIYSSALNVTQNEPINLDLLKVKYNDTDVGPYKIVIEFLIKEKEKFKINKISVARILKTCGVNDSLLDIKKASKNQLVAYFDHYEAANKLTTCQNLKLRNLKAYIPLHTLSVTGVIAGIPNDLKIEELQDDIDANGIQIIKIVRLQREVNGYKVNTNRIAITFRSNTLPRHVKLFRVRCPVEMFVPKVILCQSCLRYNHKTEHCKGYERCANCGSKNHKESECKNRTYCFYCKQSHKANGNYCGEPQKQRNIRMLMGIRRISYREVLDEYHYFEQSGFELYNSAHKVPDVYESYNSNIQSIHNELREQTHNIIKVDRVSDSYKPNNRNENFNQHNTVKATNPGSITKEILQEEQQPEQQARQSKRRKYNEAELGSYGKNNNYEDNSVENDVNNIEVTYQNLIYEVNEMLNSNVSDEILKENIKKASLKLESNIKFQLLNSQNLNKL